MVPVGNMIRRATEEQSRRREEDPSLDFIKDMAVVDNEYSATLEAKKKHLMKEEVKLLPQDRPCRAAGPVWDSLGVLWDGSLLTYDLTRLVIPRAAWKELICLAHLSHMGVICTYQSLRCRYYWKGMKNDVQVMVEGCKVCCKFNPPGPKDPAVEPEVPMEDLEPMEELGLDIMQWGGRYYLIAADRASGYMFVMELGTKSSAKAVADKMN